MATTDTARRRWKLKKAADHGQGRGDVVMRLRLACGCEIGNRVPLATLGSRRLYPCPNGHGLQTARPVT